MRQYSYYFNIIYLFEILFQQLPCWFFIVYYENFESSGDESGKAGGGVSVRIGLTG